MLKVKKRMCPVKKKLKTVPCLVLKEKLNIIAIRQKLKMKRSYCILIFIKTQYE